MKKSPTRESTKEREKRESAKTAKAGWGGHRIPGPGKRIGRPPFSPTAKRQRNVVVSDENYAFLREIGAGLASRGIEIAIEQYKSAEGSE